MGESHFPPALQCSAGALFNHAISSLVQTIRFIFYWRYHTVLFEKADNFVKYADIEIYYIFLHFCKSFLCLYFCV